MNQGVRSVKQMLRDMIKESMLVAFPIGYKAKGSKDILKLVHIEESAKVPQKKCDYFSTSGELIFRKNVKKDEDSGSYEKGYFGLPTPMEVSQDIMVQMPEKSGDIIQAMEIEQYFHADEAREGDIASDSKLVNGHHINIYLKNSFLEQYLSSVGQSMFQLHEERKEHLKLELAFSPHLEPTETCRVYNFINFFHSLNHLTQDQISLDLIDGTQKNVAQNYILLETPTTKQRLRVSNYLDPKGHYQPNLTLAHLSSKLRDLTIPLTKSYKHLSSADYERRDLNLTDLILNTPSTLDINSHNSQSANINEAGSYVKISSETERQGAMLMVYLRDQVEEKVAKEYQQQQVTRLAQKVDEVIEYIVRSSDNKDVSPEIIQIMAGCVRPLLIEFEKCENRQPLKLINM
ncbi:hypothetical protein FGO68_gene2397 [Halteria grandinella]|uniref:Uncharacterized protein n=1 Tax=Halteria grandinella TaxID=5974 RepID=A0A8J8T169_HALGN|nr:hypothetical protein FGO68_gene2397 [Halteria grandinella]